MATDLIDTIEQTLRHDLQIHEGDTIIVAVSGGPDSLCLLHLLWRIQTRMPLQLHVAHIDHQLRGQQSRDEAEFVRNTAQAWGLAYSISEIDVGALAQKTNDNLHQAGRKARYARLAQLAQNLQAHAVAVAHHANDQAETVLMHLLRGAGPAGLGGIRPSLPWQEWSRVGNTDYAMHGAKTRLIRPLLKISRAEIEAYCQAQQLDPRRDPSNDDPHPIRNRIRHHLLPQLIEYNPHVIEALGRTAIINADEHSFIEAMLDEHWPQLAQTRAGAIDMQGAVWDRLPVALQRIALRRAYQQLGFRDTLSFQHIEEARSIIQQGVGSIMEFPSAVQLTVGYHHNFSIGQAQQHNAPQLGQDACQITVPSSIDLENRWYLQARMVTTRPEKHSLWETYLDADELHEPLWLRTRQAGDRALPKGGLGSRKVQDMFVDAKIARTLRDKWPIISSGLQIVWIPGLRTLAPYQAQPNSQHIIHLSVYQLPN